MSPVDLCTADSGVLAWTGSISASGASLELTDIAAGPTDDVVVADVVGGATFGQYRWSKAGSVVSGHQDGPLDAGLTGPMITTGLFMDPSNNAFYGRLFTAPSGSSLPPALVLSEVSPSGQQVFSSSWTGATSTEGVSPLTVSFQASGDQGGGLHAPFLMGGSPQSIGDGVYCFASGGGFEGVSGASAISQMSPGDIVWVTPGNNLAMLKTVTSNGNLGCGALTVPTGGDLVLAGFDTGGSCVWNTPVSLANATVLGQGFRVTSSGRMLVAVVFSGTIDFGAGPLTSTGTNSLAVAAYDGADSSKSTLRWAKSFGGSGSSFTLGSISGNSLGDVVVTGGYQGSADLGAGTLSTANDTFLAVFDGSGNLRWNQTVSVGSQGVLRAAAGTCGLVLATTSSTVDLGSGQIAPPGGIGVAALGR